MIDIYMHCHAKLCNVGSGDVFHSLRKDMPKNLMNIMKH